MGDLNQLDFVRRTPRSSTGRTWRLAPRTTATPRTCGPSSRRRRAYVGVDLEEGPGVDVVLDLTGPLVKRSMSGSGQAPLWHDLLLVGAGALPAAVQAWQRHLTRLLKPGGVVCVSAPFAWEYHSLSVRLLAIHAPRHPERSLPGWTSIWRRASRPRAGPGSSAALSRDVGMRSFGSKWNRRRGRYLRAVSAKLLALLAKVGHPPLGGWLSRMSLCRPTS